MVARFVFQTVDTAQVVEKVVKNDALVVGQIVETQRMEKDRVAQNEEAQVVESDEDAHVGSIKDGSVEIHRNFEQDIARLKVYNDESVEIQTKSKEKIGESPISNPADVGLKNSTFSLKMFKNLLALPKNVVGAVDKSKVVVQRIFDVIVKTGYSVQKYSLEPEEIDDQLNEEVLKENMKAFENDNEVVEAKPGESGQLVEKNPGNGSDSLVDEFVDNDARTVCEENLLESIDTQELMSSCKDDFQPEVSSARCEVCTKENNILPLYTPQELIKLIEEDLGMYEEVAVKTHNEDCEVDMEDCEVDNSEPIEWITTERSYEMKETVQALDKLMADLKEALEQNQQESGKEISSEDGERGTNSSEKGVEECHESLSSESYIGNKGEVETTEELEEDKKL
jgi:hypothetical protein